MATMQLEERCTMRWKKIGDTFYAYGNGLKITVYPIAPTTTQVHVRVYTEPGGVLISDTIRDDITTGKRWASHTYLKGMK